MHRLFKPLNCTIDYAGVSRPDIANSCHPSWFLCTLLLHQTNPNSVRQLSKKVNLGMSDTPLDIEIYVKNTSISDIMSWLMQHFTASNNTVESEAKPRAEAMITLQLNYQNNAIDVMITPGAAGKAYTSIWFKSSNTPWNSDIECAKCFIESIDTEVRCSAEGWQESEAEYSEKWWKLSRTEEVLVSWG